MVKGHEISGLDGPKYVLIRYFAVRDEKGDYSVGSNSKY